MTYKYLVFKGNNSAYDLGVFLCVCVCVAKGPAADATDALQH
jgi:hypothetical protein